MATERVLHRVQLKRVANQVITPNTVTAAAWTDEDFDTDAYHSGTTNPSRITVPPFLTGWYYVEASATISMAVGDVGPWEAFLTKNGVENLTQDIRGPITGQPSISLHLSKLIYLAVSDYIEVLLYCVGGANRNLFPYPDQTFFQAFRLGAG